MRFKLKYSVRSTTDLRLSPTTNRFGDVPRLRINNRNLEWEKAGPFPTTRSLNVLKKLKKALNH